MPVTSVPTVTDQYHVAGLQSFLPDGRRGRLDLSVRPLCRGKAEVTFRLAADLQRLAYKPHWLLEDQDEPFSTMNAAAEAGGGKVVRIDFAVLKLPIHAGGT